MPNLLSLCNTPLYQGKPLCQTHIFPSKIVLLKNLDSFDIDICKDFVSEEDCINATLQELHQEENHLNLLQKYRAEMK